MRGAEVKTPKWKPNFTVKADHMSRPIIEAGHTLIHGSTSRIWVAIRVHTELTPTIPHAPALMTREIVHCWIVNDINRIGAIDTSDPRVVNDFWPLAIGGPFDTGETIAARKEIVAERLKNPKMFGNQWEANTDLLIQLKEALHLTSMKNVNYEVGFVDWLGLCYRADIVQKHGLYLDGQGLL